MPDDHAGDATPTGRGDAPVRRHVLAIAYDGAGFHGWQKQTPPGQPALRTVAGVMESALSRLLGQPINLVGASRTDAGVHAFGQAAHFDAASRIPIERLALAINSRLPEDIDVIAAGHAPEGFDAIRSVTCKQYVYRIHNAPRRPLAERTSVWHCWMDLDVDKMNAAAACLEGEHDFAAFAAAGHGRVTTVRTVRRCHVERLADRPELRIHVRGDGFLYHMVRIIAGTLVEVGCGRMAPEDLPAILASGDRRRAGPTLAASGLALAWILYDRYGLDTRRPETFATAGGSH